MLTFPRTAKHIEAEAAGLIPAAAESSDVGAVSGISGDVPRVDRFVQAVNAVAGAMSMSDFERTHDAADLTSGLVSTADRSRKPFRQMLLALAAPLHENNRQVLCDTVAASIAVDERDQVLIVLARCLTKNRGVFDILLGIERDYGTGPEATIKAIKAVLTRACTLRKGRRGKKTGVKEPPESDVGCLQDEESFDGELDQFDEGLYKSFSECVTSAVADGCYTEQRALFEMSPGQIDTPGPPVFPNLKLISRDRSHRYRSVQKQTWAKAWSPGSWCQSFGHGVGCQS